MTREWHTCRGRSGRSGLADAVVGSRTNAAAAKNRVVARHRTAEMFDQAVRIIWKYPAPGQGVSARREHCAEANEVPVLARTRQQLIADDK